METLDLLDNLDYFKAGNRSKKYYRTRKDPFLEYTELQFRAKYRFSKENSKKLIKLVEADLKGKGTKNGGSISPGIQVLAALRCWGRDTIQDDCAAYHGFTQSSMSRICVKVAQAFAKKAKHIIKMPTLEEEQIAEMKKFEKIAGFKNVIGAIDCTHMRMKAVANDNTQVFVNLNVQVVGDASLKITDIVACWRESTHDSKIFNESKLKEKFEEGAFIGRLIGDNGYKCTDYLFTPIRNPKNRKEELYNEVHNKTKNVVEKLFGVWKSRFRILLDKMRISRRNGKVLIVALAVLHNLSVMYEEENFGEDDVPSQDPAGEILQDNTEDENMSRSIYIQQNF